MSSLKSKLRARIAGRGNGIDIATEYRWVLSGTSSLESFFKNLHLILDSDAVLYFEGCSIASCPLLVLRIAQGSSNDHGSARDTIFPVPESFHVSFSPEVVGRLCEFISKRPLNELFDHLKAYKGDFLLIAFHDAFSNDCLISGDIAESSVVNFATSIGATHRRELNVNKRDKEQLHPFLDAMENPNKLRISGESWWRRFWRRWGW